MLPLVSCVTIFWRELKFGSFALPSYHRYSWTLFPSSPRSLSMFSFLIHQAKPSMFKAASIFAYSSGPFRLNTTTGFSCIEQTTGDLTLPTSKAR